jgi:hypothetical protein
MNAPPPDPKAKTWATSQAYELAHAISFMQSESFRTLHREVSAGRQRSATGYVNSMMLEEFFAGDAGEWRLFLEAVEGGRVMDIGPCVFSPLANLEGAAERICLEPLHREIDAWQRQHLGGSLFQGMTCHAVGAETFLPEYRAAIDGAIYCRNMLDHTPRWAFVLANISAYAARGCKLLLWTDLDHRGDADDGHYDLTDDEGAFKRLLVQLGFRVIREYRQQARPTLNYGCFAEKL